MNVVMRRIAQGMSLATVAGLLGWCSIAPSYTHFGAGQAMVKVSFSHGAPRVADCKRATPEELARLPPNMRRPVECPRRRLPVLVDFAIDGRPVLSAELPPSGVAGDGPSRLYRGFAVPAGTHQVHIRMRDSARTSGFDYEFARKVELAEYQNLVIDFEPTTGGFYLR